MDLRFDATEEAFREEVRDFFATELTEELREAGRLMTSVYSSREVALAWQAILRRKGWLVPSWPAEYGGTDWTLTQRYIFACERARARPPALSPMGLSMLGPALLGCGTQEQKDHYLPRILDGVDYWCQGYSEPQSGSDLASLQMSAVRARSRDGGDEYVLNGTKIWTTHAQYATHMFVLVRTAKMDRPQKGITFLLIDMSTPGITVDPIRFVSGAATQATVFFEDVRVPAANVVGEENDGWTVAKYLLEFERGGGSYAPGLLETIGDTRELLAGLPESERAALGVRLDALETRVRAQEMLELQSLAETERTGSPGPGASMLKLNGTELSQAIDEVAVQALGYYGAPHQPEAYTPGSNVAPIGPAAGVTTLPFYFNNRAATIYAGSSEVQRNIVAKAVLGL
jgi:acyl-CoA dehydrogenase